MSVEYDLKQQLDSIIDFAYRNDDETSEPKLKYFKWYKITFVDKKSSTFLAQYKVKTRTIEMRPDYKGNNTNKYVTLIHELSHHIQHKKYEVYYPKQKQFALPKDVSVHGKEFYSIQVKLLTAAFDLGIVDYNSVMLMPDTGSGDRKLKKMLEGYVTSVNKGVVSSNNDKRIYVYNSFDQKDNLKARLYSYNNQIKAWHKVVTDSEVEQERQFLFSIGINEDSVVVKSATTMLDMKAEVEKQIPQRWYVVMYYYNQYAVIRDDYEAIKHLKTKCPFIKVLPFDTPELAKQELERLVKQSGVIDGDSKGPLSTLESYVVSFAKK